MKTDTSKPVFSRLLLQGAELTTHKIDCKDYRCRREPNCTCNGYVAYRRFCCWKSTPMMERDVHGHTRSIRRSRAPTQGWTQAEMADRLEIDRSYLAEIGRGKRNVAC